MRQSSVRKSDALARLEREANIWLATASADGVPHLIPLSLAWDGTRVLVATPTASPTARNARSSGRVKASLDSADDVVLIDGTVTVVDFDALRVHDRTTCTVGRRLSAAGSVLSRRIPLSLSGSPAPCVLATGEDPSV